MYFLVSIIACYSRFPSVFVLPAKELNDPGTPKSAILEPNLTSWIVWPKFISSGCCSAEWVDTWKLPKKIKLF